MEINIVESQVTGVVCGTDEGGWHLRLQAPSILEEAPEEDKRDYIWYAMRMDGWRTVSRETTDELEAAYMVAIGKKLQ